MRRLNASFFEDPCCGCGKTRQRPFEACWNPGVSKSRQIRPQQSKLLPHPWYPSEPYDARFIVAVNEHGNFGLAPWLSKPILTVKHVLRGNTVGGATLRQGPR